MKPKFIHLYYPSRLLILIGLIVTFGCAEEEPGPVTADSAIIGRVNGLGSADALIDVTAIGPYGTKKTTVEDNKNFIIGGLGNGTYELEFSGKGYGTWKEFGIQLFGGDTVRVGFVSLLEKYEELEMPNLLGVTDNSQLAGLSSDAVAIRTAWRKELPPVRFFIGFDKNVDTRNYEFTEFAGRTGMSSEPNRLFVLRNFYQLPLESGQTVYMAAYVCNGQDDGYLDLHTNQRVFPTAAEDTKSEVLQFEIP
jgi:hypothetical protein